MNKFDSAINEYIELSTVPGLGSMLPISSHTMSPKPEDTFPNAEVKVDVELPDFKGVSQLKKTLQQLIKRLKKEK